MNELGKIQFGFEIAVAVGLALGLIPFGYLIAFWWVIPLAIANVILAVISNSKTMRLTITTLIMTILSLIPILGYIFRIIGIITAVMSANQIGKKYKIIK